MSLNSHGNKKNISPETDFNDFRSEGCFHFDFHGILFPYASKPVLYLEDNPSFVKA